MYNKFGINFLNYLKGMYAFALFDKKKIKYLFLEINLESNLFFIFHNLIFLSLHLRSKF